MFMISIVKRLVVLIAGIGIVAFGAALTGAALANTGVLASVLDNVIGRTANVPPPTVPGTMSYQGRILKSNGQPYSGLGYFKFAVVDGASLYWTNDGSTPVTDPFTPTNPVTLTVNNGIFSLLLGDNTLPNMTPLAASLFSGSDRRLRVWFSPNGSGYEQLANDVRLASVPYAYNTETLAGQPATYYLNASNINTGTLNQAYIDRAIPRLNRAITTSLVILDASGTPGSIMPYTSLAIGTDGLPIIAYANSDSNLNSLKVAHCADVLCTSIVSITLDSRIFSGSNSSLAVGADGLPVVSYYVFAKGLRVAHCGDTLCSSAVITTLAAYNGSGSTSLAIGADGLPIIAYTEGNLPLLKVAHCGDGLCSSAITTTVEASIVASFPSLAIGVDGLPLISYYDGTNNVLKVAHCGNAVCSNVISTTVDASPGAGYDTSLAIGTDGLPVIAYRDNGSTHLKVARCNDALCSSAISVTVDNSPDVGSYASLAIGADGQPVISYYDNTNGRLKVAHCNNALCSSALIATTDASPSAGTYTSLAIGADGLPLISYLANFNLKVAHCSNAMCIPYVRHR